MGHTLLLELPEEIYQPLVKTAQESGYTPEQVATTWLITMIRQTGLDPLEQFIGAFRSKVVDWTDQHDHYLGQELFQQMQGQAEISQTHE